MMRRFLPQLRSISMCGGSVRVGYHYAGGLRQFGSKTFVDSEITKPTNDIVSPQTMDMLKEVLVSQNIDEIKIAVILGKIESILLMQEHHKLLGKISDEIETLRNETIEQAGRIETLEQKNEALEGKSEALEQMMVKPYYQNLTLVFRDTLTLYTYLCNIYFSIKMNQNIWDPKPTAVISRANKLNNSQEKPDPEINREIGDFLIVSHQCGVFNAETDKVGKEEQGGHQLVHPFEVSQDFRHEIAQQVNICKEYCDQFGKSARKEVIEKIGRDIDALLKKCIDMRTFLGLSNDSIAALQDPSLRNKANSALKRYLDPYEEKQSFEKCFDDEINPTPYDF